MREKTTTISFLKSKVPRLYIATKTGLVFLMMCSLSLNSAVYGQKIDIAEKGASGEVLFRHIRQASNYTFVYDSEAVSKIPPFTINVKNASVDEIMKLYLKNTNFTYIIDNNTIIIRSPRNVTPQHTNAVDPTPITGVVTDAKNTPISGVTVKLKSTKVFAITDKNGRYQLTIPNGVKNPVLVVSYVGMKTQEVTYTDNQTIDIMLEDDVKGMDDVVVTGIFNKRKESYTGAVRVITAKDLKQFEGRNLFTTLGNIDPSFYVVPNNAAGSDPNQIPTVQLRGARSLPNIDQLQDQTSATLNTPLIILDGFESSLQRMLDLDNNELESITLLKDGSATALYGSRGANGVIVIKTKEPAAGKLRMSYRAGLNLSVPDLTSYNLLNSSDKLELERLSGYYQSATQDASVNIGMQQYYNQVLGQVAKGVNTDWLSVPLRTELDQNHNLKIEGGDQAFRYDLALQYNNRNGVMKESGRRAFNGTINLSYRHKDLTFRNSTMVGQTKSNESPYGSFADYAKLNPYWEPYNADGTVQQFFTPYNRTYMLQTGKYSGPYANPLFDATLNTFDISNYTSIVNNFQIEYTPTAGLLLRGGLGVTSNASDQDNFKPASHSAFSQYSIDDIFRKGSYTYLDGKEFNYTANVAMSYSKLFAEQHRLYAGVQLDMTQNQNKVYTFDAEGFPDESIDFLGMALQYKQNGAPQGLESTTRRVGAVANVNYALKDKYLADVAYRIDGASQFGTNRRFAPFWSAGLGWNIHYENFIKDNFTFIDRLKLRASYGSTGTTQFSAYQAQGTYGYVLNDRYKTWLGAQQKKLGNPDLEWQKTGKYNAGLEMTLFKNRLTLEGDVFSEKTSNLLSSLELPYANGFASYVENIGELKNSGVELMASVWILQNTRDKVSWSITGNLVFNQDRIVKLSKAMQAANEQLALQGGFALNKIIREGASMNTIYTVKSLGIDPSTGKELFESRDGQVTYMWNPRDRVANGIEQPKFRGNFSTLVRYGSLSMNASFGYRFGGQIYNQTLIDKIENADRLFNVDARVFTDRWKAPGDVALYRGLNETLTIYPSSRFVQDENTITCQNINLSYDIRNPRLLKSIGLESLTLTGNTGELFYSSSVRQERGTAYPFTRQFSMSLYAAF